MDIPKRGLIESSKMVPNYFYIPTKPNHVQLLAVYFNIAKYLNVFPVQLKLSTISFTVHESNVKCKVR